MSIMVDIIIMAPIMIFIVTIIIFRNMNAIFMIIVAGGHKIIQIK